jgi:ABC-type uncharacterized transport system substrate-binding protein
MQFDRFGRREFITLLGSAAATWPLAARAQQGERKRHIGMLMAATENDMEWQNLVKVFIQRLQELGWTQDRNLKIDFRWAETGSDRLEALAKELVELKPELIISQATITTIVLLQQTRTVPIIFLLPIPSATISSKASRIPTQTRPDSSPSIRRCPGNG